jgi:hypothetical protein
MGPRRASHPARGYGYTGVKGLNALIGTLSTPTSAPVIAATRLRKGSTSSPRGAASFVAATLATARRCGGSGLIVARMDSAFYTADVVAAVSRAGARFSITARLNASVRARIAGIAEDAWTPIHYPNAIWDDQAGGWVSDAEVAETTYTAFTSRGARAVTARLIVRRVKLLPPAGADQPALIEGHRHHPVFTNSPLTMLQAETCHRGQPSSNTSSPTSKQGRWRTCRPDGSPPTPPGSPWPRSHTTSPAPPAASPRRSTVSPARPRSVTS